MSCDYLARLSDQEAAIFDAAKRDYELYVARPAKQVVDTVRKFEATERKAKR